MTTNKIRVQWTTISPDDGLSSTTTATDQRMDEDLEPVITALETTRIRPLFQKISRFNQTTKALGQGPAEIRLFLSRQSWELLSEARSRCLRLRRGEGSFAAAT